VLVELAEGDEVPAACGRLAGLPEARYAEPDWVGEGGWVPNDTWFPRAVAPAGRDHHDIAAVDAWDLTRGSEDIVVAVLDTGIAPDHPDLAGRILPGYDFVNDDGDPTADHPHGIQSTGILGANADDRFGVAGVDHRCRILPVKILDEANRGTEWALVKGLVWASTPAPGSST